MAIIALRLRPLQLILPRDWHLGTLTCSWVLRNVLGDSAVHLTSFLLHLLHAKDALGFRELERPLQSLESLADLFIAEVQVLIRLVDVDDGCGVRALLENFIHREVDSRALAGLHLTQSIKCAELLLIA